jgi:hypothetical protein
MEAQAYFRQVIDDPNGNAIDAIVRQSVDSKMRMYGRTARIQAYSSTYSARIKNGWHAQAL